MSNKTPPQFVVCLRNDGYEASLEPHKIYQVIPDKEAEKHKMLPASLFASLSLPQTLAKELAILM